MVVGRKLAKLDGWTSLRAIPHMFSVGKLNGQNEAASFIYARDFSLTVLSLFLSIWFLVSKDRVMNNFKQY